MNSFPPLAQSRRIIQDAVANIRESRFFHDRFSAGLLASALLLNALTFVWLLLKVRPTDVPVPVHYSNLLNGFDQLGPWYFPFFVGLYAVTTTIVNGLFAYQSFGRSRLVSFFLLVSSNVVAAFGFIIASALGTVR